MSNSQPTRWTPEAHRWKQSQNKSNSNKSIDEDDIYADENMVPNSPNLGLSGIASDVGESIAGIPEYGMNAIGQIPSEVSGAVHMPLGRSLKNLGAGAKDLLKFVSNPAGPGLKYLSEKKIPYVSKAASKWPQWPEEDVFGLGKSQPGDTLWQNAIPFAALGRAGKSISGLKGLASRGAGYGGFSASKGENPIQSGVYGALLENAFKKGPKAAKKAPEWVSSSKEGLSNLRESFNSKEAASNAATWRERLIDAGMTESQANSALSAAKAKLESSENKATHRNINKNPEILQGKVNLEQKKANNLQKQNIEPERIEPPKEPELPPEHKFKPLSEQSARLLQTQEQKAADAEKNIQEHLGYGQTHHRRFAIEAGKDIQKIEDVNNQNYAASDKHLDNESVVIKKPEDAKKVAEHVSKVINENDIWSDKVSNLPSEIEEMNREEHIPAKKYMQLFRKVRDAGLEANHQMKDLGGSSTEAGERAYNQMKKLQSLQEQMYNHLELSIPKEAFDALNKAQKYFSDVIVPMRKSSTLGQIIYKKSGAGRNILKSLTEIGQEPLQNMVYKNPELMRLAVGQKFAEKPAELHKPNEHLETELLPRMSQLKGLKESHAKETAQLEKSKEIHKQAIEHDKEQSSIAKEREKERNKIKAAHEKATIEHQEKQQDAIKKAQDDKLKQEQAIKDSENKIRTYKKQISVLRARHDAVNATTREKLHASLELKNVMSELEKAEKILEERKRKWKKLADIALRLLGAKTLINKIS